VKYNLNPTWGMKFNYSYVNIHSDDANSSIAWQQDRNISFKTPIHELALSMEFNFFKFDPGRYRNAYTPYVFAGIGVAKFTPKGEHGGYTYELAQFKTEKVLTGNKEEDAAYRTNTLVAPFGLGFKYSLDGTW